MQHDPGVSACYDCDYHPDEDHARLFTTAPTGVLRLDDEALVTEVRWDGETILRHYAFADRWVKVNVGRANDGTVLDLNCDIATPMIREGHHVYAADLFIDVLVEEDGRRYRVQDEDEFEDALNGGLISEFEAAGAREELNRFIRQVERGALLPWLDQVCAFTPPNLPPQFRVSRAPVPQVLRPPRQGPERPT